MWTRVMREAQGPAPKLSQFCRVHLRKCGPYGVLFGFQYMSKYH